VAGELSRKIEKAAGPGRGHNESAGNGDFSSKGKILSDAGISTQQASDWERLSEVPDEEFETALDQKEFVRWWGKEAAAGKNGANPAATYPRVTRACLGNPRARTENSPKSRRRGGGKLQTQF
jgi:hypothetical protein